MAKKLGGSRIFRPVTKDSLRILNSIIPYIHTNSRTANSDRLAIAILQKFFGPEWIENNILYDKTDKFLNVFGDTSLIRETHRVRRILLAEMLYNLQATKGFASCWREMYAGQIEPTYALFGSCKNDTSLGDRQGIGD